MTTLKTKVDVKVDLKDLEKAISSFKRQSESIYKVGNLEAIPHPKHEGHTTTSLSYLHQVAAASIKDLPVRPFMKIALESKEFLDAYNKSLMEIALNPFTKTKNATIAKEARKLAVILKRVMIDVIENRGYGEYPPNSLNTIFSKKSDIPLVETGVFIKSLKIDLDKTLKGLKLGIDTNVRSH